MDPTLIMIYTAIIVVLILFSAYFSATETAFSSLNKTRLKTLAEKGNKRAKRALALAENYDALLSTILVGNNIVNIAASSLSTLLFVGLCMGDSNMGAALSTVVITVAVLIFGEVTPKSIAKDSPESFAMFSAPLIRILSILLYPINQLFSLWKKLVGKIFRVKKDDKMSQEELLMLVEEVEQEGTIEESGGDLLRNAIEFTGRKAEDILTHRVDLEGVSKDASKDEIARVFSETKFSRLLVYEESIDNIIGVIHQKDFYTGSGLTSLALEKVMTPPIFVPKSEKINDLLQMLQKNKSHVAVVLDEYGGTLGIVTMEDILEELVGEIWDEHDEIVEKFRHREDGLYSVDCSVDFDEFCDYFEIKAESESVSLSGWVTEMLGRIPEENASFTYENLTVTVESMDSHRVAFVTVLRAEKAEEEAESEE